MSLDQYIIRLSYPTRGVFFLGNKGADETSSEKARVYSLQDAATAVASLRVHQTGLACDILWRLSIRPAP